LVLHNHDESAVRSVTRNFKKYRFGCVNRIEIKALGGVRVKPSLIKTSSENFPP